MLHGRPHRSRPPYMPAIAFLAAAAFSLGTWTVAVIVLKAFFSALLSVG